MCVPPSFIFASIPFTGGDFPLPFFSRLLASFSFRSARTWMQRPRCDRVESAFPRRSPGGLASRSQGSAGGTGSWGISQCRTGSASVGSLGSPMRSGHPRCRHRWRVLRGPSATRVVLTALGSQGGIHPLYCFPFKEMWKIALGKIRAMRTYQEYYKKQKG